MWARVLVTLLFTSGLCGCIDEHGETTCEEKLDYVRAHASDPPTQGYDTVGATLGLLKKVCPAEYENARAALEEAGYFR
jgi:hypothetical protein